MFETSQAFEENTTISFESYQPYFVGELGAQWQFPSDHLPRGATVGNFHIAFWNILNKDYLGYIEANTQGLRHSSLLTDNIPIQGSDSLTIRERICGEIIMEMINHPTHPRSLIALEEVHPDVQKYLKKNLPSNWSIATQPHQPKSEDIFLYDTKVFKLIAIRAVKYSSKFPKSIFTITLLEKASNKIFRFVQSHIPGGPINSAEGCAKFSQEALLQYSPNITIVLMGDMNQSPDVIQNALEAAAKKKKRFQPYSYLPVAYPSHIDTEQKAAWIDHFFIFSSDTSIKASDIPEELCHDLTPIVNLLNEYKNKK
jgi:hypothetical protein